MDHNMAVSTGYLRCRICRGRSNAPPSDPVWRPRLCAGAMPLTLTVGGGSGLHSKPMDAVIGRVFGPYRPSGRQGRMPKKHGEKAPCLLAVSLAAVMPRYDAKHIAQLRGSRATREATGWHFRASIAANNSVWTWIPHFFSFFIMLRWRQSP